jgi:hypothetical protein
MKKLIFLPAVVFFTLALAPNPVVQNWDNITAWQPGSTPEGNAYGILEDTNGSEIEARTGITASGDKALRLSWELVKGGYAGSWNWLERAADLSGAGALKFKAKSSVKAVYTLALKDENNVLSRSFFLVEPPDWGEVVLPLSSLKPDPNSRPGELGSGVTAINQYDDDDPGQWGTYVKNLWQAYGGFSLANADTGAAAQISIENMGDLRRLAVAEVYGGPGYLSWSPRGALDLKKIRMICISPVTTGKGDLSVGPITAVP